MIHSASAAAVAPADGGFRDQLAATARRVESELAGFLADKRRQTAASAGPASRLVDAVSDLAGAGGKRLRPALVFHAYRACGGVDEARALRLALSTELLHTYLLIHDDIMDHAEVRRGLPAAHVAFAQRHREAGFRGDAEDFGRTMAILAGDLAASYSNELFVSAAGSSPRRDELESAFATMCQEVIHGQYLEILASYLDRPTADDLERVLRLKSGRYSVERPTELGALLADADAATLAELARYGSALGEAFQLQDDLLGLFGDAATVGKPVGGDLLEGKFTFLVLHALEAATGAERELLEAVRGHRDAPPEQVRRAVAVIADSGARDAVQRMISERLDQARRSLAHLALAERPSANADSVRFLEGLIAYSEEREQ